MTPTLLQAAFFAKMQTEPFITRDTIIEIAYLVATALFILSLKWLSSPKTARHGVLAGEIGMVLAIAGTLLHHGIIEYKWIAIALVSYNGRLTQTKVDPVRIEGEAASARLMARLEGLRYEQSYSLNQIQGVRMLDEPIKP